MINENENENDHDLDDRIVVDHRRHFHFEDVMMMKTK